MGPTGRDTPGASRPLLVNARAEAAASMTRQSKPAARTWTNRFFTLLPGTSGPAVISTNVRKRRPSRSIRTNRKVIKPVSQLKRECCRIRKRPQPAIASAMTRPNSRASRVTEAGLAVRPRRHDLNMRPPSKGKAGTRLITNSQMLKPHRKTAIKPMELLVTSFRPGSPGHPEGD